MEIDLSFLKAEVRKEVPERRYIHSLGVADTAKYLAEKYGGDPEKAEIAGILHDLAKYWSKERLAEEIQKSNELNQDLLAYNSELWHGPVASVIIQERYQITDEEIIMAIRYHTSGREHMSLLEKIVCLADYIEPSRQFPGVEDIRELAEEDLDEALRTALDGTIHFLIKQKMKVYPETLTARNDLITKEKRMEAE